MPSAGRPILDPAAQALICEQVTLHGDLGRAAAEAQSTVREVRRTERDDPTFAQALQEAFQDFKDTVLIPAARARAVDGVPKLLFFQGTPLRDPATGEQVVERTYSDGLLLRLLEVLDSRFRPHSVQENRNAASVSAKDLDDLTPDERAKLEEFLDLRARRPAK